MLQTIGGDCETAIGGLAEIANNNLTFGKWRELGVVDSANSKLG